MRQQSSPLFCQHRRRKGLPDCSGRLHRQEETDCHPWVAWLLAYVHFSITTSMIGNANQFSVTSVFDPTRPMLLCCNCCCYRDPIFAQPEGSMAKSRPAVGTAPAQVIAGWVGRNRAPVKLDPRAERIPE